MGRPHLTEAERVRVRTLKFDANFTSTRIMEITGYGRAQVRNALKSATVGKRSGRPTALTKKQEEDLVEFVTASKKNRSMSYQDIAKAMFDGAFGETAIRNTLRRNGFTRSGPVLKQIMRGDDKSPGAGSASPAPAEPAGPDGQMEGVVSQPGANVGAGDAVPAQGMAEGSSDSQRGDVAQRQVAAAGADGAVPAQMAPRGPGEGQVENAVPYLAMAVSAVGAVSTQRVAEGGGVSQIESVAQSESPATENQDEDMSSEDEGVAEGRVPRDDQSRVVDAGQEGNRGSVAYALQTEARPHGIASAQTPGAVSTVSEGVTEGSPSPEAEARGEDRRPARDGLFTEDESEAGTPISRETTTTPGVATAASGSTPGADVLSERGQTPARTEVRPGDKA